MKSMPVFRFENNIIQLIFNKSDTWKTMDIAESLCNAGQQKKRNNWPSEKNQRWEEKNSTGPDITSLPGESENWAAVCRHA